MIHNYSLSSSRLTASAQPATTVMQNFVHPLVTTMCAFASLVCVFFLVAGGIAYITSAGKPDKLQHAKKVIRNALIGLMLVMSATVLTHILINAYPAQPHITNTNLPKLEAISPNTTSDGLVAVLIKVIAGFLNDIIQSIAVPFLKALSFFTTSTPLMTENAAVFNLWRVMVSISDVLTLLVVSLLGFHVMGASVFGFNEVELKHLLPRVGLIFLLANASIFAIDGVIELSNAMINAINTTGGSTPVWSSLSEVVKHAASQSVAALLIMIVFLAISLILLIYYIGRLITLYIGAVLAPLISLLWLIPGFRSFSETAAKTYVMTIFVLFVHVTILQLAASLFAGMQINDLSQTPDTLIAMLTGIAALITLLKTQGVMAQLSYVNIGSQNARRLGGQFISGISYLADRYGEGYFNTRLIARAVSGGSSSWSNNSQTNTTSRAPGEVNKSQQIDANNKSFRTNDRSDTPKVNSPKGTPGERHDETNSRTRSSH